MKLSEPCFHCGESLVAGQRYPLWVSGQKQWTCCPGCQAVAEAILAAGDEQYYQYRTQLAARPEQLEQTSTADLAYDSPELTRQYVEIDKKNNRMATFIVEGMVCAACGWLLEKRLSRLPGVESVQSNLSTQRITIVWSTSLLQPSHVMTEAKKVGYQIWPMMGDREEKTIEKERRSLLMRLGLAGFGMMQVMMYAVALYLNKDMNPVTENFLRWTSLFVAMPVVVYAAGPFFSKAWQGLKQGVPGMDLPVSIAIGSAFVASLWHTITGQGEVYFESVSMFTFFLLLTRYLQLNAKYKSALQLADLALAIPQMATRLHLEEWQKIPAVELNAEDIILVLKGESLPADGLLLSKNAELDTSLMTGESRPIQVLPKNTVYAGSVNVGGPIRVSVTHAGPQTRIANLQRLTKEASTLRPKVVVLADRVARWFVPVVLVLALSAGLYWWPSGAQEAFEISLAVLVVTCPCALSLAMPMAFNRASSALHNAAVAVTRIDRLLALSDVDSVIFDKTGTLTTDQPSLEKVYSAEGVSPADCVTWARQLAQYTQHPVAKALRAKNRMIEKSLDHPMIVYSVNEKTGSGIEGVMNGQCYRLGNWQYATEKITPKKHWADNENVGVWLADEQQVLAGFVFDETLRPGVKPLIKSLRKQNIVPLILSGDQAGRVRVLANEIGGVDWLAERSPEEKLENLHRMQMQGRRVVFVGDGQNDAPVLAGADVSFVLGAGSDLARKQGDFILLNNDLSMISQTLGLAKKTRRVIRQNITWAISYNLLAIPLAWMGLITPWMAALGMSVSALGVVLNTTRLSISSDLTKDQNPIPNKNFSEQFAP